MKTIYKQMKKLNIPMSNHASDLYVKKTKESTEIIEQWEYKGNVSTFINQTDITVWYDIPFAYDPFWERRKSNQI